MRKSHLFAASLMLLVACNTNPKQESKVEPTNDKENIALSATADTPKTIDWEKPMYSIDDHGDTITRWVYDERGRLSKILYNFDDLGQPKCVNEYVYNGNKAHVTFSCEEGYEEDITYTDASCNKILENSGQIYQYDADGRLEKIIIGNMETTYDYEYNAQTGLTEIQISDSFNHVEHRDSLNRLVYESYIENGLDVYSTTYTYEGNVCHAVVENTIYVKDESGAIPDLENFYVDTYEYEIYY